MATVRYMFVLAAALLVGLSNPVIAQTDFIDPLDRPASSIGNLMGAHLNSVTTADKRLIAVGARGLIIVSDNAGATWTQVSTPVSSDLLAVHFPTAKQGWAVGHDGVILHSADGGGSWVKQFDGNAASKMLIEHFDKLAAAGDETATSFQEGIKLNYQDGPEQALMGVWFSDENNGVVVGTFGTLLATHDGGKTWESWMERADNPEFLHYLRARPGVQTGRSGTTFHPPGNRLHRQLLQYQGNARSADSRWPAWHCIQVPGWRRELAIVADRYHRGPQRCAGLARWSLSAGGGRWQGRYKRCRREYLQTFDSFAPRAVYQPGVAN
jgi:hypothetical protein